MTFYPDSDHDREKMSLHVEFTFILTLYTYHSTLHDMSILDPSDVSPFLDPSLSPR